MKEGGHRGMNKHAQHSSHAAHRHFTFNHFAQRALDIVLASLMLAAAAPVMIAVALLVKFDSPGPILYSQTRVGLNRRKGERRTGSRDARPDRRQLSAFGQHFPIYKFRSMRTDAEKNGAAWCRVGDSRVTRLGRILRQTHLDELPQLFNILSGDMSIVGPRPERPEFIVKLAQEIPHYHQRLHMKPGLTGLAQVRHRSDLDLRDVKKKVRYDLVYRRSASLATNVKIILATVPLAMGIPVEKTKQLFRFRAANRFAQTFSSVSVIAAGLFSFWKKHS